MVFVESRVQYFLLVPWICFTFYFRDTETVSGLPKPTQESVEILKSHLYTSLTSLQLKFEQKVQKYPFTAGKTEVNYIYIFLKLHSTVYWLYLNFLKNSKLHNFNCIYTC